jgi:hypothetical protein
MTKHEICVHIKDEEMLQKAKELLEKHGEKINKSIFYLDLNDTLNYLYCSENEQWGLSIKTIEDKEITLEILDDILACKWRP